MIALGSLRECFRYNDWARDGLLRLTAGLSDAQLDRPFEMGAGSLRATIYHLWAAEYGWLDRWQPGRATQYDAECHGESIAEIGRRFRQTAAARDAFLGGMDDARLAEKITCTSKRWGTANFSFGDMMLHVCNHGAHHRAQAINMLRHLGVAPAKPPLDYIFMKMEPAMAAAPALDGGTLRAYYAYADWARARVYAVAAKLSDEQLDRPFEIGMGCVRATLGHLRDAEQWWLVNWTRSPDHGFPAVDPRASITELSRRFDHTAAERNELLNHSTDDDLQRLVTAKPHA